MSDNFEQMLCQAKPISFRMDMVLAILHQNKLGTPSDPWQPKRETRRAVKLPQWSTGEWSDFWFDDNGVAVAKVKDTADTYRPVAPDYTVGDLLYVKETVGYLNTGKFDRRGHGIYYRADHRFGHPDVKRWRGSRFMFKDDARLILRVTDVSIDCVQNITEEGAVREGARLWAEFDCVHWLGHTAAEARINECCRYSRLTSVNPTTMTSVGCFAAIWNKIHGKEPQDVLGSMNWFANPVVQAVRFEIASKREGAF